MIEVGEYVRTKEDGYIGKKVKDGLRKGTIEIEDDKVSWIIDSYNITKHRKKLIDLIEEHDIIEFEYDGAVYKEEVIRYDNGDTYYYELSFSPEDGIGYNISIFDEDIEIISILTHEQFEQTKYKVKEN